MTNEYDYSCELKTGVDSDTPVFNVCISTNYKLSLLYDLLSVSNNYVKILRIFSYVLRFVINVKQSNLKESGPLSVSELDQTEKRLIRMVQEEVFLNDIQGLKQQKVVPPKSKLKNLNPFLDSDRILRVDGRLGNSDLPYDAKYPAILPHKHKLTNLIIVHCPIKNLHTGASSLLHLVRERFWPLGGRSLCRKLVCECIVCFKAKPIAMTQLMGSLPIDRVVPNFPFNFSGVDFCGPFMIKYRNQRKGVLHKMYLCIFVCFVTKALHIEMVSDLTSEALIATLKRFFARRGKSSKLYSDNGKNFVGANREINKLLRLVKQPEEEISAFLSSEDIEWKFIPPRAPSFGGLWEAAVKSVKYHLKRVVGKEFLTYEEFLAVCIQIGGILNSRPLCPLSSSVDDLNALTPAHFLIGRSMNSIVEPNLIMSKEGTLRRWQNVTKLVQLIWNKWYRGYLSDLQQRNKWQFKKCNIKIGDLVILIEDNMPTFKWPLGRIVEIFSGTDNLIRVVMVKTQHGEYKRAISRVCLLPMPNNAYFIVKYIFFQFYFDCC
ncbi:uncharacterized protein [Parasteatoda tepidariorum]|uniref:uncharacterized protein n=1 Tax=Parasteatoda tepidariorum TaxID=114398 RepID=UPI0039BCCE8E